MLLYFALQVFILNLKYNMPERISRFLKLSGEAYIIEEIQINK